MRFKARQVAVETIDENYGISVWFTDAPPDSPADRYVALMRSLNPRDDDGVYIERDDQIWSAYDGVAACRLYPDRLEIHLNDEGVRKLRQPDSQITIDLDLTPELQGKLRHALPLILRQCATYSDQLEQET